MLPLSLDRCSSTVAPASMACALQTGLLGLFGHPPRVCRPCSWGLGKFRASLLEGLADLFHPGGITLPNSGMFPCQIKHADGFALHRTLNLLLQEVQTLLLEHAEDLSGGIRSFLYYDLALLIQTPLGHEPELMKSRNALPGSIFVV